MNHSLAQSKPLPRVTEDYPFTYIAGPMTNYPDWNTPAFEDMARRLRRAGLAVISPNELHEPDPDKSREWYLRRDIAAIVEHCGRIVFLRGWERSWGANLEHSMGFALGCELIYPHELDDWLAYHAGDVNTGLHPESLCGKDCTGCCSEGEGGY